MAKHNPSVDLVRCRSCEDLMVDSALDDDGFCIACCDEDACFNHFERVVRPEDHCHLCCVFTQLNSRGYCEDCEEHTKDDNEYLDPNYAEVMKMIEGDYDVDEEDEMGKKKSEMGHHV